MVDLSTADRRTLGDLLARVDDAVGRLDPAVPMRALFESEAQELIDIGAERDRMIGPTPPWPARGSNPTDLLAAVARSYAHAIGAIEAQGVKALLVRQSQEIEAQVTGA